MRFLPSFTLEGHDSLKENQGFTKLYPDRVIPVAMGPIGTREDAHRKFLTTEEMGRKELKVGETAWGIATWEDLDPKINRFSVLVVGLTNAYRWEDTPGEYKEGDSLGKGRKLLRKTLKVNFWSPGDEFSKDEGEFRLGDPNRVDFEWIYR